MDSEKKIWKSDSNMLRLHSFITLSGQKKHRKTPSVEEGTQKYRIFLSIFKFREIEMQFLQRKFHTSIKAWIWSEVRTNKEVTAFWKSCKMHLFQMEIDF